MDGGQRGTQRFAGGQDGLGIGFPGASDRWGAVPELSPVVGCHADRCGIGHPCVCGDQCRLGPKDPGQAEERFRQLRDAGMSAVLVSVSPFHQDSIPLQTTLDGISAARGVFGAGRVMVYQAEWLPELAQHGLKTPVPLDQYRKEYGKADAGLRFWMGFGLIGGGRAGYRLGDWIPNRPAEAFTGMHCLEELAFAPHSHLDLYGNFVPSFCGGISLGDWHDLPGLVGRFRQERVSRLVRVLMDSGPYGLFQLARDEYGYQALSNGYADKCHLCMDVRKHFSMQSAYPETLKPTDFYQKN